MTSPNDEPVMNTAEVHTIEHLAATFLRNHAEYADKTIYFGPMGCRTGFYLILVGSYESKDIVPLLKEMYRFMADFEGEVPGASAKDCGNYLDMIFRWQSICLRSILQRFSKTSLMNSYIILPDHSYRYILTMSSLYYRLPESKKHAGNPAC